MFGANCLFASAGGISTEKYGTEMTTAVFNTVISVIRKRQREQ